MLLDRLSRLPLHLRVAALGGAMLLIVLVVAQTALLGTYRLSAHEASTLHREVQATVLLLNADRDLYQAHFALDRAAEAGAVDLAQPRLAEFRENHDQVLMRFTQYRGVAAGAPGESLAQAHFERCFAQWSEAARAAAGAVERGEAVDLDHVHDLFLPARAQLDVLEEQFYEVLLSRRASELRGKANTTYRLLMLVTAVGVVLGLVVTAMAVRASRRQERALADRLAEREAVAARQVIEHRIAQAIEMAQSEAEALDVVRGVVAEQLPGRSLEVMLADSSRAHLTRVLTVGGSDESHETAMPRPFDCPAVRRGHLLSFTSSTRFDACPHLRRMHPDGACATCVPLSVMGQTMGVVSAIGAEGCDLDADERSLLEYLVKRLEDRLGVMRAFARSEAQASTDPLTGLLNRRSFEALATRQFESGRPFALAFGDIDHFKRLNDTHGHETGDRALRLLSRVFRDTLRDGDLAARWGGEEFLLLLPGLGADAAAAVLERVRVALREETAAGRTPPFTISFGVGDRDDATSLDALIRRVDVSLLAAKAAGRDRIVRVGDDEDALAKAA